jgi:hypothetical protein
VRIAQVATLVPDLRSFAMSDHPNPEPSRTEEQDASSAIAETSVKADSSEAEATTASGESGSPAPEAALIGDPRAAEASEPPVSARSPWWRRSVSVRAAAIVAASLLVVGGVIGWVIGFAARPAVNTTAEFKAMQHSLDNQLSDTKSQLGIAKNDLDAANQHITDIADREAALTAGEAKFKADQAALDAQTKQVQSTQFGDGIHLVGTSVTPGVYSINNGNNCYYAWMSGTGAGADIIDNNIVSGPAVVTLNAGDVFETSRCGTWTKTG